MTRFLILIVIAFVLVSATLGWMLQAHLPGATVADIFLGLTPGLKLLAVLIVVLTGVGVVGGLRRDVVRVRIAAIMTVAIGVMGAAYGELNTHLGMIIDGPINFATMASGRIESLAILVLGLFGAFLGLGALQLRGGVRRG